MITIILPGYSVGNKKWAIDITQNVKLDSPIIIHEWGHWSSGGSFSVSNEVQKIISEIGGENVNIIAKSVGTRITMKLIPKIINKINRIILCGIPTKFESQDIRDLYKTGLKSLPPNKIICIQNTNDPFSPFSTVSEVIHSIDSAIQVIEKPRNDHHYPYYEDFQKFLSS